METTNLQKIQSLLTTATESINEAMALSKLPQCNEPYKRKIYVSQQRPKGCKDDDGWSTLFADIDPDEAQKWVDSRNGEDALFAMEYRVLPIDLYFNY